VAQAAALLSELCLLSEAGALRFFPVCSAVGTALLC